MEFESMKFLATLGVGGVLAGVIFWFYRRDANEHSRAWQGQAEILLQVVRENTIAVTGLQQTTMALQTTLADIRSDMRERTSWFSGLPPHRGRQ